MGWAPPPDPGMADVGEMEHPFMPPPPPPPPDPERGMGMMDPGMPGDYTPPPPAPDFPALRRPGHGRQATADRARIEAATQPPPTAQPWSPAPHPGYGPYWGPYPPLYWQ